MSPLRMLWLAGASVALGTAVAWSQLALDAGLVAYDPPAESVQGTVLVAGFSGFGGLLLNLQENFTLVHPGAQITSSLRGNRDAAAQLGDKRAQVALSYGTWDRPLREQTNTALGQPLAEKLLGYEVAVIYMHADNPLARRGLAMPQLDAIFSSTRRLGEANAITTWGAAGARGAFAGAAVKLFGVVEGSPARNVFLSLGLGRGEFSPAISFMADTPSVIQAIAADKFAIGYGAPGFASGKVVAMPVMSYANTAPVAFNAQTAAANTYPLGRLIYVYALPDSQLTPVAREFVKYLMSREGQRVLLDSGFVPYGVTDARNARTEVGLAR